MRTGTEPARGRTPRQHAALFSREGTCWTIVFEGPALHLRAREGLRHLARLLERPGEPVAAVDLAVGSPARLRRAPTHGPASARALDRARARVAVTKRIRESIRTIGTEHP